MTKNRIYIDTNVAVNDFLFRNTGYKKGEKSSKALDNLYKRGKDVELYMGSFAIAQYVALLSKKHPLQLVIKETNRLLSKFIIINFGELDIKKSIDNIQTDKQTNDLEDQMQFELCKKMKCSSIITLNHRDFKDFANIYVVKPQDFRSIFAK